MLTINGTSQNWNGTISYSGDNVANVDGTVTGDNVYMNLSSMEPTAMKSHATDVAADVAEFIETILA